MTAGVDLAGLVEADVVVGGPGGKVTITLPRAEIFSQRLDSERTYVHSRSTDVLATRRENLETRARQEAERSLAAAALEGGILARAEKSVSLSVGALVRSQSVSRTWKCGFAAKGRVNPPSSTPKRLA